MIVLGDGQDFLQPQVGDPEFADGTRQISRGVGAPTGTPAHTRLQIASLSFSSQPPRKIKRKRNTSLLILFLPSFSLFFPQGTAINQLFSTIFLNDRLSDDTAPTPFRHHHRSGCLLLTSEIQSS